MVQKEDENLEEFVERLQYNSQRSNHPDVSKDILKTILLKGVRDDVTGISVYSELLYPTKAR